MLVSADSQIRGMSSAVKSLKEIFRIPFVETNNQWTERESSKSKLEILRENIPVERSLITGSALIDEAIALWFAWSKDADGLPDWSAFRPFDHPRLLTNVSVCKRIGEHYRCILVGEGILQWMPTSVQGRFIHEVFPPENGRDVTTRFTRALEDELPNYVEKALADNPEHDFGRYCTLNLPFGCARDGHDRILTFFDFKEKAD